MGIVRYAPTAMNLQEISWHVISSAQTRSAIVHQTVEWMRSLADDTGPVGSSTGALYTPFISRYDQGEDIITHQAPHLLISTSPEGRTPAYQDAVIATAYLDLIAPVYQLGTCWSGIMKRAADHSPDVLALLGLKEGYIPHTVMMIGYPRILPERIPDRKAASITWG